jgi:hypothetical protein
MKKKNDDFQRIINSQTISSIIEAVDDMSVQRLKSASSYDELEQILNE